MFGRDRGSSGQAEDYGLALSSWMHRVQLLALIACAACAGVMAVGSLGAEAARPAAGGASSTTGSPSTTSELEAKTAFAVRADVAKGPSIRLAIRPSEVKAAESIKFRVEDRSDADTSFGPKFKVQVQSEGGWMLASFSPRGPWPQKISKLRSGESSQWQGLEIPADAVAGRYRITKEVQIAGHRRFIEASFSVSG